jgi:hypothetical protein
LCIKLGVKCAKLCVKCTNLCVKLARHAIGVTKQCNCTVNIKMRADAWS